TPGQHSGGRAGSGACAAAARTGTCAGGAGTATGHAGGGAGTDAALQPLSLCVPLRLSLSARLWKASPLPPLDDARPAETAEQAESPRARGCASTAGRPRRSLGEAYLKRLINFNKLLIYRLFTP